MNTVLEHSSPEGKDPGEKAKGEQRARSALPATSGNGALTGRGGWADLIIGTTALSLELAILVWRHIRHMRTES